MPQCKTCGAKIAFIRSKNGVPIPVDPKPLQFEPDPDGPERLVTESGRVVQCRLTPNAPGWDPFKVGYRSHFATCPQGEKMRRARAIKEAAARREKEAAQQAEAQGEQLHF